MLSTTDMKYYTDPIVKPDMKATRIFVNQVRYERHSDLVGQIVNVKDYIIENTRVWWLTDSGNYVTGPSAGSMELATYSHVLAKYGDMFVMGEMQRRRNKLDSVRMIGNARMSTAQRIPGSGYLPVTDWIIAASWAWDYMPQYGDSEEVVQAKLACAKRSWEVRHAQGEIMLEGVSRQWTSDLKRLEDTGTMPTGYYGAACEGVALLGVSASEVKVDDYHQQIIEQVKRSKGYHKSREQTQMYVSIPVKFFANMEARLENATTPPHSTLSAHVQRATGSSYVTAGPMQSQPVLMGTY